MYCDSGLRLRAANVRYGSALQLCTRTVRYDCALRRFLYEGLLALVRYRVNLCL